MRTRTFQQTYGELVRLVPHRTSWGWYVILLAALILLPLVGPVYISTFMLLIFTAAVGAIGLNLVTGSAGLISLGHAGFLAIGAYTTAILTTDHGLDIVLVLVAAGLVSAAASLLVGIPSLRLKGLYLAITTLAFSIIVTQLIVEAEWLTGGSIGKAVTRTTVFGFPVRSTTAIYYVSLAVLVLSILAALNMLRSRVGRAWTAIRDYDTAARMMGINLVRYKLLAFAVSAFLTGVAGGLSALYVRYINIDGYTLIVSVEAVAMILVGGLGSVRGAVLGAILITILPDVSRWLMNLTLRSTIVLPAANSQEIKGIIYALMIILFLRYEPDGLAARWVVIKRFWSEWPLGKVSG